jgi:hypothetical protein
MQFLMDYYGSHAPWPFIAIPSGNYTSGDSTSLNLAWNPLTVGGVDDQGTGSSRTDDVVDATSRWTNPTIGTSYVDWEVPSVVAPSLDQVTDGQTDYNGGTSMASAQVAGIATQVLSTNTAMETWPEPIRALIICSADQDVDTTVGQMDLNDGTDDKGGAGEVNGQLAVTLADTSNRLNVENTATWRGYNFGSLRQGPLCDPVNNNPPGCYPDQVPQNTTWNHYYHIKWDPNVSGNPSLSSPKTRVVFTWDAHASCSGVGTGSATCVDNTSHYIDADFDIYVYRDSDNHMMAYSDTVASNWEMVEFVPAAGVSYTVKIVVNGWWLSSGVATYYGMAWNTATYATK